MKRSAVHRYQLSSFQIIGTRSQDGDFFADYLQLLLPDGRKAICRRFPLWVWSLLSAATRAGVSSKLRLAVEFDVDSMRGQTPKFYIDEICPLSPSPSA